MAERQTPEGTVEFGKAEVFVLNNLPFTGLL